MVLIKGSGKVGEILTIWSFWLTCEKVGSGFQYHDGGVKGSLSGSTIAFVIHSVDRSLFVHLIPVYGLGFVRLSVQPKRHTFVHSPAKSVIIFLEVVGWVERNLKIVANP